MSQLRERMFAARNDLTPRHVANGGAADAADPDLDASHLGEGKYIADILRPAPPPPPPKPRISLPPDVHASVHRRVVKDLGPLLFDDNVDDAELEARLRETIVAAFEVAGIPAEGELYEQFATDIRNDVIGYGPIEALLNDDSVTEVMVNGPDIVFVEREGKVVEVASGFVDAQHVRRVIDKIVSHVGRRIDESSPMVDARLPDGSRVNAVIPPLAIDGPFLTIRKFAREPFTAVDLVGFGTLDERSVRFLRACIEGRLNIVVSGGTGSGKTTLLNVLSSFIPHGSRIVTVEDAKELQLHQRHVLCMETRPPNVERSGEITIRDLVRNSLRMRPDRIVVGECRGGEALDMLQAMNTGHDGSMTTVHSNSPRAFSRIETLTLMAGFDLPVRAIREQVASAVDLIVQLSRLRDGSRRVTHITEVEGMEGDKITLQDIYLFDFHAGVDARGRHQGILEPTGVRPAFAQKLEDAGLVIGPDMFGPAVMSALGQPIVLVLLLGIVGGLTVATVIVLRMGEGRIPTVREHVAHIRPDRRAQRLDDAVAKSPALRRAVEVTTNLASRRGVLGSVERSLRAADVPVRPAELILAHVSAIGLVTSATLLVTRSIVLAVIGFVVLSAVPTYALKFLAKRRRKRFGELLPDALTGLAGSLRAGRSVGQAMDALSREMADPMGRELRKVVTEARLGRSLTEALVDSADRIDSPDYRWAVLAMQIQAEVGGNLAELLDQVAATVRGRWRMKGEIKALTAEGRASAIMLVILVPGLGLVMAVVNRSYMAPLVTTSIGRILLMISFVMITGGYFWMNKMVKIDV